jgi:threonine/homoserine/homoserine lactone efflux protein
VHLAAFLLAVFPLIATPGASLTLLTHRVAAHGPRQGVAVFAGTATGLYVHALLAAAGLSAVVMSSSRAFAVVRMVGAAYLIGLGIWTLRRAGRPTAKQLPWTGRATYPQAVLGNVLNPKAASIFLTLAPQFVDPHRPLSGQILVLATAQVVLVGVWLGAWTAVLTRARRAFATGRLARVMRRVSGTVLVFLGVRTAIA